MKEPKVIFRRGDVAKIIIPKVVKRVGYPKSVDDYLPSVNVQFGEELAKIFYQKNLSLSANATRAKVEHELAYMLAKQDMFGGPTRSVHLEDLPDIAGRKFFINSMKTYMEGTYYPASRGGGYDYEHDEPAGLSVSRGVRVAIGHIENASCMWPEKLQWGEFKEYRIPVAHLEKLP